MNEKPLTYVPIDCRLRDNPKMREFASLLGDPHMGHAYYINLLFEVGIKHPVGTIINADFHYIAKMCDWRGEPEVICEALQKSGLVSFKSRSSVTQASIKNWDEYGGRVIKERQYHRNRRKFKSEEKLQQPSRKLRKTDNILNNTKLNNTNKKASVFKFKEGERDTAMEVYSHWSKYHPHAATSPTDRSLSHIVKAMRSGRSAEQLTRCVDGYHHDTFYKGNPACLKLSWIFLDDERVEAGRELRDKQKPEGNGRLSWEEKKQIQPVYDLLLLYGTRLYRGDLMRIVGITKDTTVIEEALKSIPEEQRVGKAIVEALNG